MASIKSKVFRNVTTYFFLTLGAIIAAFALENFLIPNTILDGGVTGIGIIISKLINIPLSVLVLVLNIPFMVIGYKNLGTNFLIRTLYSVGIFSLGLSFFSLFNPITEDMLLALLAGGVLLGTGVGLIIYSGGCIDGTESVAIVISKKTTLSVGQIVLICNLIIFGVAGSIFGFDRAMYSLFTYFVTYKVIDFITESFEQAKACLIVTEKGKELSKLIYERLGRTTTTLKGKGLLSGDKEVLYSVITRIEVYELKRIIEDFDASTFVTVLDVSDIVGNHIKSTNHIKKLGK